MAKEFVDNIKFGPAVIPINEDGSPDFIATDGTSLDEFRELLGASLGLKVHRRMRRLEVAEAATLMEVRQAAEKSIPHGQASRNFRPQR